MLYAEAMDESTRHSRFRFRLRTILFVPGAIALLLVVAMQQVQISRQRAQIKQLKQQIDSEAIIRTKLTTINRELRDYVERNRQQGPSRNP